MVEYLKLDPNENHEAFKGALFVIGTNRRHRMLLKHDWSTVEKLWVAFMKTKLSEKLSVVRLMESITEGVNSEFQTIAIEIEVSDQMAALGEKLMVDKSKLPPNYLQIGAQKLAARNEENRTIYHRLINEIINHSHEQTLHWRYNLLCSTLVNDLMHPVAFYSPLVSQTFARNLIHDSVFERVIALKICNTIMKQQKREHVKISIQPYKFPGASTILPPGVREDNKWLQYDVNKVPKNQEEWDEPRYAYKVNGFFGWTPKVEIYAPSAMQPNLERSYDMLSDHEKVFFDFFSNAQNVDKLISFWSLEEKKGNEKFSRSRFWLIKQVFNTFGDTFLDNILRHIEPLIKTKSESSHRCAAEVIAGIIRGAKHWNFEKTRNMYEKIMPLVRLALDNITSESDTIWGCAFATASEGIDPNKQFFLHETLLENPIREEKSFFDCSRLYCLQGAFNQHAWRMVSVASRLLTYLTPFFNHPFQNVRERIGSTLINIFENDMNFGTDTLPSELPQIRHLLELKRDELALLKTDENQNHGKDLNFNLHL
jgi:proteasome activator subunit 4